MFDGRDGRLELVLSVQDGQCFGVDLLRCSQHGGMESEPSWPAVPIRDCAIFTPLSGVDEQQLVNTEADLWRQLHEARGRGCQVELDEPVCELVSVAVLDRPTFLLTECGAGAGFDEVAELGRSALLVVEGPLGSKELVVTRHIGGCVVENVSR